MMRFGYLLGFLLFVISVTAQRPTGNRNPLQNIPGGFMGGNAMGGRSGGGGTGPFKDSLIHRTGFEDSATIAFRYLDTSRFYFIDSTVSDFSRRCWVLNFWN